MIISELLPNDVEKIRIIHQKYFSDLEFPDFFNGFMCAFSIKDDKDNLIVGGGVRLIAESILFTDKQFDVKTRISALLEALQISTYVCKNTSPNLNQLHAFVSDDVWSKQLQLHGFRLMTSKSLILDL